MDKLENLIEWLEERKKAHHDGKRNLQQLIGFHEGLDTAIQKIKLLKEETTGKESLND